MNQATVAFVVSPTEYGGQVEHAFDTAVALSRQPDVQKTLLVTRPGATDYLGPYEVENLDILEILPPRRVKASATFNLIRPVLQVFDLCQEHLLIRRVVLQRRAMLTLIVLDTSRYPVPKVLSSRGLATKIAIFVHNAKPHVSEDKQSLRQRLLRAIEKSCINGADLAITHGERQLEIVAEYTSTRVVSVPLPKHSFLDRMEDHLPPLPMPADSYSLCIGELRENKGIETAMQAAETVGARLIVAGKSENQDVANELNRVASQHDATLLLDRFLDKPEFDHLIQNARVVLLPYTHFDAQSGVLAKAMKAGRAIIASDLPALREQAANYEQIEFVQPSNSRELGQALFYAMSSEKPSISPVQQDSTRETEWNVVARTVLTCA